MLEGIRVVELGVWVAGPAAGPDLPRPVDSLFLVQGALSLWSYASDIPYAKGTAGYFNRILARGLVRDEAGAKMSKTKGNVVDPLEVIDSYGADALRYAILASTAQGRDIKFGPARVEG